MTFTWDALTDVAFLGIGMAIVATLLWAAYRTMDHPRLPLIRDAEGPPRVSWAGVGRYAILTPLLVGFWMSVLLLLVAAVSRDRDPEEIVMATGAVIAGARLLAHIKTEIANELAKTVPIVMLSVIIIGGQLVGLEGFEELLNTLDYDAANALFVGLVVWDYLLTALWFLVQRRRWRHRDEEPGLVSRLLRRWRGVGYTA